MPEKILVTGGNGYIGSHLIKYYNSRGFTVHNLDIDRESILHVNKYHSIDVSNINSIDKIKDSYDIIFHCAGCPSVPHSVRNPLRDFKINLAGSLNMLEFVRKSGSKTFVFLSTVSVFDVENELPLVESSVKRPSSPYGAGKLAAENYCLAYKRSYNTDTRTARIFNTYGPGVKQLFIADMLKNIRKASEEVVIGGTGNQIRDYVYITDLVKALAIIAEKGQSGEDYNICSGRKITLYEITKILLEKMRKLDLRVVCDGKSYPGDIEKWYGTPKKLNNLGFKPEVELEEGLEQTVKLEKG